MYEEEWITPSEMVNQTASAVRHVIGVLDADVSELDPNVVALSAVCIPLVIVFLATCFAWIHKCKCCCFCCFGRRLLPDTDSKEDILGDEEFDTEAVHTDPKLTSESTELNPKKRNDTDDGIAPTSPPVTESSEDEVEDDGDAEEGGVGRQRSLS